MSSITWLLPFCFLCYITSLYLLQCSHIELVLTLSSFRKIVSSFLVYISSQSIKESQEQEAKCTLSEPEAKCSQIVKSARTGRHSNDCDKRCGQENLTFFHVSVIKLCTETYFIDSYFIEFGIPFTLTFFLLLF